MPETSIINALLYAIEWQALKPRHYRTLLFLCTALYQLIPIVNVDHQTNQLNSQISLPSRLKL